jgi:hypothetical protein
MGGISKEGKKCEKDNLCKDKTLGSIKCSKESSNAG